MKPFYFYLLLIPILLFLGCATTDTIRDTSGVTEDAVGEEAAGFSFGFDIDEYRIKPESVFYTLENTIPEPFQVDPTNVDAAQRNSGFRVQIISTQDVRLAERLQSEFKEWLYNEVPEYEAESYLLFRQPFYRLHVGNFFSRAEAIEFSRVVKRRFPDAWVVFDQIDPEKITRRR